MFSSAAFSQASFDRTAFLFDQVVADTVPAGHRRHDLFRPYRAAEAPSLASLRAVSRARVVPPVVVTPLRVGAEAPGSRFQIRARHGLELPTNGALAPQSSGHVVTRVRVRRPQGEASASFRRYYCGCRTVASAPECGAEGQDIHVAARASVSVLLPTAIQNLTDEMLLAIL